MTTNLPDDNNQDDDLSLDSHSISKTQIKKEMKSIELMGKNLLELTSHQLEKFNLDEKTLKAIIDAKKMSRAALNRQLKFIRKLLEKEDLEAISEQLDLLKIKAAKQNSMFHKIESWRDQLVAGNMDVIDEIGQYYYDIDRQYIRQLVNNAQKEQAQDKPTKSAKLLFKYLRQIVEI